MKQNRWQEGQPTKTSLFVEPALTVITEPAHESIDERSRYAFDNSNSWRREQMVRVEREDDSFRVWFSVISISDREQRFSLRDLPESYHVTPMDELSNSVWLSKGVSPDVITTEFTTNGRRVIDAKVYMDRAMCRTDTYGGADRGLRNAQRKQLFPEEMDDRTQVVARIHELTRLKSGPGQLQKGINFIAATQSRILSRLASQANIPIPLVTHYQGFECYVVPDQEREGWYTAPIGKDERKIHSADVIPTKFTAPGRRQLDAFVGRQMQLVASGLEHRYGMNSVANVCRYHNRRYAA